MTYDLTEDARPDPLVTEADVAGLYPADVAAVASRGTNTWHHDMVMNDD